MINENVRRRSGAGEANLARTRDRELQELERRRATYLGDHPRISPAGRTVIVVDDILATGATMKAALIAMKSQGAAKIVVAIPVAPMETLEEIASLADVGVCLNPERLFGGVEGLYHDFHQLTDEETVGLLRQIWVIEAKAPGHVLQRDVKVPPLGLVGDLRVPAQPRGIIVFAHGSGSSRLSPRNVAVADALNGMGFATLLLDLLTPLEAADRRNVFDIQMLAERLVEASLWVSAEPDIADLPLGLFGASTGAGAALVAASELRSRVAAVVSRGGRPDLVGPRLAKVEAPTLLIVGGNDHQVIELNRQALAMLNGEKLLRIVPGATHLFEESGAIEAVTEMAGMWFQHYLVPETAPLAPVPAPARPFANAEHSVKPVSPMITLRAAAEPLPEPSDPEFGAAFDRFGDARIVLLGEASHGTSEFYRARAAITQRLIERHGFSVVAVEADWPDAAAIDRYVRKSPRKPMQGSPFSRFPTWMWRNREVDDFVGYLRSHNAVKAVDQRVGFYGLDLSSMTALPPENWTVRNWSFPLRFPGWERSGIG